MAPVTSAELHHVALEVHDLVRSEWFYDRFLGRLGFRRFAREATYLAYSNGTLTLWLMRPRNPRIRRNPPDPEDEVIPEHLAFRVSSREEVARIESDLGREGIFPLFRTEEHPQFRAGYVSATWVDPNEVVIEVYTVPAARRAPSRRPTHRSVRRRSRGNRR